VSAHVTAYQPDPSRLTVRCGHCHLVQFETQSGKCRKCKKPYEELHPFDVSILQITEEMTIEEAKTSLRTWNRQVTGPRNSIAKGEIIRYLMPDFATALRAFRHLHGWSQSEFAAILKIPRTYISKIESDKCTPNTSTIGRLSQALGITERDLVQTAILCAEGSCS